MIRFQPHGRIHEWAADELGFFQDAGLEYEIVRRLNPGSEAQLSLSMPIPHDPAGQPSAYLDFLQSSARVHIASTSCWAVAAAVSSGYGRLWPHAYGVMPAGIYVRPSTLIRQPQDLEGLDIIVGRHSGSHFSALHALDKLISPERIKLKFVAGRTERLEAMLADEAPAGSIYGAEAYVLEQNGFHKVVDTSFIVSYVIVGTPSESDVAKYFSAMRRAQMAIDENPAGYRHYLLNDFPDKIRRIVDVHRCGIGERVEFNTLPVSTFQHAREWLVGQSILPKDWIGPYGPDRD